MNITKIIFGIICYKERYYETNSFKDLVASYEKNGKSQELHIFVFDNTDILDWKIENRTFKDITIHYEHDKKNPGIAFGVNRVGDFARKNNIEWIVILDQDTRLPTNFYDVYSSFSTLGNSSDIAFPKVYAGKSLISPCKYNLYRASQLIIDRKFEGEIELKNLSVINSGMMIRESLLSGNNGYNEALRLDFCDHEFIERLNNKSIFGHILGISLNQNFSADTNNKSQAISRYKLYVKDMKVYKSNKNKFLFTLRVDLPHLLKETIKYRSLDFLKIRFS